MTLAIDFDDIRQAAQRLAGQAHRTPVLRSRSADAISGASLFFKCENLQRMGAFKFRGATNAVLQLDPVTAVRGVATHSSGNHGAALALAALRAGLPATVVQSRARHILLRPTPKMDEAAARDKLFDFRQRIQAGKADFADLAKEFSQDGSAKSGGDLGWASPGMFVPEFEDVMNSLAPGEIAPPLVSRFGVHLIQLMERREATLTPAEQRQVARNLVREKKLDEAYVNWAQEVRGRAFVELRDPPE